MKGERGATEKRRREAYVPMQLRRMACNAVKEVATNGYLVGIDATPKP